MVTKKMPQKPRYDAIRARTATKSVDNPLSVNGHDFPLNTFGEMANDNGLVHLTKQIGQFFKGGNPVEPDFLDDALEVINPCDTLTRYFLSNHPERPRGANAVFIDYDNPLPDFSRREPTFVATQIYPVEFYRI